MFEQVLKSVNAKYVYGLTATPVRADGRQESIFMQCGEIAYRVDAIEQAQRQLFRSCRRAAVHRFSHAARGGQWVQNAQSDICGIMFEQKTVTQ